MLVVDASCAFELVTGGPDAPAMRRRVRDDDLAAPHLVDAEVIGVIRRQRLAGVLDDTAATLAIADLGSWPCERFDHRPFLPRVWELRDNVRSWDAFYVALAEALDAVLLTKDVRVSSASGVRCAIEVLGA